ncbi:Mobile element protein [Streptococcus sp. DD10]|uniref:IS30 family transposase n=1 Tax=Streptococcus sp. DD10 TaxID=1777878 RepID=UPI0007911BC3|nr:IS30 family transposase [Streptococcus sp. DD10]KXT73542.1 Mobile element protein [Streptococcus sp. DD10]
MQNQYTTKGHHLTLKERQLIEKWKNEVFSNRKIAGLLGKAPQTIHNEIKRGLVTQQVRKGKFEEVYKADYAQIQYLKNRERCVKDISLDKETYQAICHYARQKYSPDKKTANRKRASLNSPAFGKSIEERPFEIDQRTRFGDFEIDTVLEQREKAPCLLTLTDRKTRYEIIRLLPSKTAQAVNEALLEIQKDYSILSITADNGREFARLHEVFDREHIYYAHPYASWERGSNENHNRLIRRWFPKGTRNITHQDVRFIENWINHYPRKMFDYSSPADLLING